MSTSGLAGTGEDGGTGENGGYIYINNSLTIYAYGGSGGSSIPGKNGGAGAGGGGYPRCSGLVGGRCPDGGRW